MAYLSAKKIYPGDMTEPLNGWYQNIDTRGGTTVNASKAGPTSVLATPGWQFYQQRGYVAVTSTGYTTVADVIIPSPYKNDDTRTNITGMQVDADSTRPVYVYRTAISVASGWGDGRVAEDGLVTSGATQVIGFGVANGNVPVSYSGVVEGANITATASGIAAGTGGLGICPLVSGADNYHELTSDATFKVFSKTQTNSTSTNGGFAISAADAAAGRTGYILCEVCYIRQDVPVEYDDLEQYLPYKVASNYPGY